MERLRLSGTFGASRIVRTAASSRMFAYTRTSPVRSASERCRTNDVARPCRCVSSNRYAGSENVGSVARSKAARHQDPHDGGYARTPSTARPTRRCGHPPSPHRSVPEPLNAARNRAFVARLRKHRHPCCRSDGHPIRLRRRSRTSHPRCLRRFRDSIRQHLQHTADSRIAVHRRTRSAHRFNERIDDAVTIAQSISSDSASAMGTPSTSSRT
jgi:hypothetical protein